ncbi:hypothetical protein [Klebsiella pneumoniae]|uniref:hypothetical protein n=1 Tax=Klebsiella pneumoniae TaxID=573 RepID=UPI00388EA18C
MRDLILQLSKSSIYSTKPDSDGNLKSWEEAVSGLAAFLDAWQKVGVAESRKRAKRYLTAMPAWAHKADK